MVMHVKWDIISVTSASVSVLVLERVKAKSFMGSEVLRWDHDNIYQKETESKLVH